MTEIVNKNSMSDVVRDRILDAAMEKFIRHGFRRTTMGDIAAGAEMSRPAVYLVYRNKEEIFRAVVTRYFEEARRRGEQRIAAGECLEEKLEAVMKTWVVEPYRLISRSPEAQELHEISFSFAADLRKRMMGIFEQQLMEVMEGAPEVDLEWLEAGGFDVGSLAGLMARTAPELKRIVGSAAELERWLATMLRVNVAVLTGSPGR